ncbi:MAG: GNAT family N-acetyltransferase [Candidatus Zixiibacteriota bacterium]
MTIRELRPTDWPHVEKLFGAKGACGGCWCMYWRIPHGGKMWREATGEPNRKAMMKLIKAGKVLGVLAFDQDRPVGWCSFGRRTDFPRTETAKAYRRDDIDKVWSINCFYIDKEYRQQGLVYTLAETAIKAIKKRKGRIVEAYPVPLTKDGNKLPAAFVYTGPEAVFKKLGFKLVQRLSYSRPLYRLEL